MIRDTMMILALTVLALGSGAMAQSPSASDTHAIDSAHLIQPEDLVKVLQSKGERPLILQVGFHVLYAQNHVPGAEYVGAGGEKEGLEQLRKRVQPLPRGKAIVIYCGCCPWSHCPNLDPAFKALREMGFTNVKALYIANNFGQDWVAKGYPTEKGR